MIREGKKLPAHVLENLPTLIQKVAEGPDSDTSLFNRSAEPPLPPGSDVDIGILPASHEPWDPRKRVQLTQELEDLFQVQRVDLVLLPEADPFLALDIIRGELLYAQELNEQARYELFVLRRAGDLMPFKKERMRRGGGTLVSL